MSINDLRHRRPASSTETPNPEKGSSSGLGPNCGPESRQTASTGSPCKRCGLPLTGRQERFCSDTCRMQTWREDRATRLADLLTTIERSTTALRAELLGDANGS